MSINEFPESVLDIIPREVSTLCKQCGACCFMLRAEISEYESCELLKSGIKRDKLIVEDGDKLFLRFPCAFLHGRPLTYVRCLAYHKFRPEVCKTYLCRTALMYKLRQISLEDALFELRSAFMQQQPGLFNWGFDKALDMKVLTLNSMSDLLSQLKTYNIPQEFHSLILASSITPIWNFKSDVNKTMFSMLMEVVRRGDFDPRLFVPDEVFQKFNDAEKAFSAYIVEFIMKKIMEHFVIVDDGVVMAEEKIKKVDATL